LAISVAKLTERRILLNGEHTIRDADRRVVDLGKIDDDIVPSMTAYRR